MLAGALEIQFLTNMAKFTAEVTQMNRLVGNTAREMNSALATVKTMFGALTAGLSVAAIVAFGRSTIDAISKMKDLGQEAGTTASAMSRFEEPARKAGVSMDSVASAMFRLNKAALEAKDPQSKAAQALNAIGISTAQIKGLKPDEMFELIARQSAKYGDGLGKNAVLQELLSKSAKEMNKIFAEIADTKKLVATMTDEEAEAADRFNDQMVELKMNSEKGWRALANEFLPSLNDVVKAFIDGQREGGIYQGVIDGLSRAFAKMRGDTLYDQLRRVNEEIEKQRAADRGELSTLEVLALEHGNINKLLQDRANIQHAIHEMEMREQNERALRGLSRGPGKPSINFDPEAAKAAAAADKQAVEMLIRLQKELAGLNDETKQHETLERTLIELQKAGFEKLTPERRQELLDAAEKIDLKKKELETTKFLLELNQKEMADAEARGKAIEDLSNSWEEATEALALEAKLIGLSNVERQKAILLEKARLDIVAAGGNAAAIRDINDNLAKQLGLLDQIDATQRKLNIWTELAEKAGDFFSDLVMNGRSAFDSLRQWAKQLLAEMIKIFATRWILQMGAAATGSSALGAQAANYGTNTLAGTAMNAAGSYLGIGGAGLGSSLWGAATSAGVTATETGVVLSTGSMAGTAVGGGVMGGVYTALASIPVWGWIAMAVIAAIAFFSGRGGGPKVEGSSVGSFDASGNSLGAYHVSDEYGNRFLRGTQMDSALDPLRTSTGDTYRNLVGLLGGTFGTAGFGFGASNDPAGDARSRVFGSAMVNGRNVFDGIMDVDDKEVDQALMLTSKRAILAALQATDFDDEIDAIFAGAGDVAKLTGEQIDVIIAKAREMYGVIQGLKTLGLTGLDVEALRQFATEGESIGQTFQRVAGAWLQLQDAFTSDETKIANASEQLRDFEETLNAAGLQMPVTREGWLEMMRGLDLSTEAGRSLFTQMMQLAPAFDAVASASQALLDQFDEIMGASRPGYTAGLNQAALNSSLGQFMAGNAWTNGMTAQQVLEALRTITREDFRNYLAADPTMAALILRIAKLDGTLNGTNTALGGLTDVVSGASASGKSPQEQAFEDYYRSQGARRGLGDYLTGSLLGSNSPLDPRQQLTVAEREYRRILTAAQGGDLASIQGLQGAREAYIEIARQMFGSTSAFVDIFTRTFNEVAGVAGVADYNTQMLSQSTAQSGFLQQLVASSQRTERLLQAIYEGGAQNANYVADKIVSSAPRMDPVAPESR